MIEIVYSTARHALCDGRAYANPRFFSTPRDGVSKVFIVGNWPAVEAAYAAKGVPVVKVGPGGAVAAPDAAKAPEQSVDRSVIPIPEDWRDRHYIRKGDDGENLRTLAQRFSTEPIINKAMAVAAITAEVNRRAAA